MRRGRKREWRQKEAKEEEGILLSGIPLFRQFTVEAVDASFVLNKFKDPIEDCQNVQWYLLKQTVHTNGLPTPPPTTLRVNAKFSQMSPAPTATTSACPTMRSLFL